MKKGAGYKTAPKSIKEVQKMDSYYIYDEFKNTSYSTQMALVELARSAAQQRTETKERKYINYYFNNLKIIKELYFNCGLSVEEIKEIITIRSSL